MVYKNITLEGSQKIFFTSDTHYGHKNICRGVSEWDLNDHGGTLSVRDFDTLDQMNQIIVDGINNTVGQNDWLIHVGDWSFGGIENIWNFRSRIVCNNVVLVLGNHDEHIANNKILPNKELYKMPIGAVGFDVYAQEIFESVWGRLQLHIKAYPGTKLYKRYTIEINHFPWVVWDKAHKDRIHLYGHVHGSYVHPNRAMDVGIDSAKKLLGEYRPFSLQEVLNYTNKREFKQVSHHSSKTN